MSSWSWLIVAVGIAAGIAAGVAISLLVQIDQRLARILAILRKPRILP